MATWKAYLHALAVGLLFLGTAVIPGTNGERVIAPALGDQSAHVIGTPLFIAAVLAITWAFVGKVSQVVRLFDLWLIGVLWTAMTMCFELGFFHFVAGVPWDKLLADYSIVAGRLCGLVLLTTLCGSALVGRLHASSGACAMR